MTNIASVCSDDYFLYIKSTSDFNFHCYGLNFPLQAILLPQVFAVPLIWQTFVSFRSFAKNICWLLANGLGTDGTYHCHDHQVRHLDICSLFYPYFFHGLYSKRRCDGLNNKNRFNNVPRVIERGRVKCGQYWPLDEGSTEQHGYFLVRNTHIQVFQDFKLSHLELYNTQVNKTSLKQCSLNNSCYNSENKLWYWFL